METVLARQAKGIAGFIKCDSCSDRTKNRESAFNKTSLKAFPLNILYFFVSTLDVYPLPDCGKNLYTWINATTTSAIKH